MNERTDPLLDPRTFASLATPELRAAAIAHLRGSDRRSFDAMLNYSIERATEHSIEAAQRFVAGDIQGAIDDWNRRPGLTEAERFLGVEMQDVGNCRFARADGSSVHLFPHGAARMARAAAEDDARVQRQAASVVALANGPLEHCDDGLNSAHIVESRH